MKEKNDQKKGYLYNLIHNPIIIGSILIIIWYLLSYCLFNKNIKVDIIKNVGIIAVFLAIFIGAILVTKQYRNNKKINYKMIIIIIILIGLILRTVYILYTPINVRQHDVGTNDSSGHLSYIETIYKTGKLPKNNEFQRISTTVTSYNFSNLVKDKYIMWYRYSYK